MDHDITRAERLKALEATVYRARGGLTAMQVTERLSVHRSTAYRDLQSLERTEVPVWSEGGRFGLLKDGYLATVRLDLNEALALYLCARPCAPSRSSASSAPTCSTPPTTSTRTSTLTTTPPAPGAS